MRKHTNRALLLSFVLHIGLILMLSPFVVNHFDAEKESIAAEILKVDSEKRVKRQVYAAAPAVDGAGGRCRCSIQFTRFTDVRAASQRT